MKEQIQYFKQKLDFEIDPFGLYVKVREGEKVVIFDARDEGNFELEHISGAVNIPYDEITEDKLTDLDKDALFVVYSEGTGCNMSTHAALTLSELGYKVKELVGGIDWWRKYGFSTEGEINNIRQQQQHGHGHGEGGCCGGGGHGHGHGEGGCGCH